MDGQKYKIAQYKVINTVRNAATREKRDIRPSVSRGNLNTLHSNIRSASQPTLISGIASKLNISKTSTMGSSFGDSSSIGLNDPIQGKIILASIDSCH